MVVRTSGKTARSSRPPVAKKPAARLLLQNIDAQLHAEKLDINSYTALGLVEGISFHLWF
ncbi:MAG: hypothetical protein JWR26_1628 [Pedosphaera sp.]|nr:hypothetical protein [Pedosphaera sp.]